MHISDSKTALQHQKILPWHLQASTLSINWWLWASKDRLSCCCSHNEVWCSLPHCLVHRLWCLLQWESSWSQCEETWRNWINSLRSLRPLQVWGFSWSRLLPSCYTCTKKSLRLISITAVCCGFSKHVISTFRCFAIFCHAIFAKSSHSGKLFFIYISMDRITHSSGSFISEYVTCFHQVSIFVQEGDQLLDGSFVISLAGPVPANADTPGLTMRINNQY